MPVRKGPPSTSALPLGTSVIWFSAVSFFCHCTRRAFLSAAALFFLSGAALAQAGFQPGYLVRTPGDTIRGEIENRRAEFNARTCRFRATSASAVEDIAPTALAAYGVAGHAYESVPVASIKPDAPDAMRLVAERTVAERTVAEPLFLEVLAPGPITLLYLAAAGTERFFIRSKDGALQELTQQKRQITKGDDGVKYEQIIPVYRGTLADAFRACPAEQQASARVELKYSSLLAAVQRYNTCVTGVAPPVLKKRFHTSWGVLAGATVLERLRLGDGSDRSIHDVVLSREGVPVVVGATFGLTPTRVNSRLTYQVQVVGASHRLARRDVQVYVYNPISSSGAPATVSSEFRYSSIEVALVPRYHLRFGHGMPYVECGLAYFRVLGVSTNRFRINYLDSSNLAVFENQDEPLLADYYKTGFNFLLGVGAERGRGSLGLRLSRGYQLSPYVMGSRTLSLSVVAGFALKQ